VKPEIAQRPVVEQRLGGGRKDDLPTVCEGGDASAAVDVDADIALGRDRRRAGVQAHPHGYGPGGKCLLGGERSGSGAFGRREGNEEGVSLGVDLDAAVRCEGIP
jgi:hypothetical protein